jgi:hypothetical protein
MACRRPGPRLTAQEGTSVEVEPAPLTECPKCEAPVDPHQRVCRACAVCAAKAHRNKFGKPEFGLYVRPQ